MVLAAHGTTVQNNVLHQSKYMEESLFFMNVHHKAHVKWALRLLCILAFTLFLVACGNGESTTNTSSTSTPTPTPSGTTYTGNGYTLSYPVGWKVSSAGLATVFSSNSNPTATFSITVTPATPLTGLDQLFTAAQDTLKTNPSYQQVTTDLPPTSIGGDTWQETGGTYSQNSVQTKGVVLGDQHPASTGSVFIITLTDKADSYDQTYSSGFQPMLQSFKFS